MNIQKPRICIIEDRVKSLEERYSCLLNQPYELLILLDEFAVLDSFPKNKEKAKQELIEKLKNKGFENVSYFKVTPESLPKADLYFSDGLSVGRCFYMLEQLESLNISNVFIYSDSFSVMDKAKEKGYKCVKGNLMDIVESHFNQG